jgi:holo-[acyl-carrier protein] synthase
LAERSDVIGVGLDLVDVDRMAKVIDRTPRVVERILSTEELDYCRGQRHAAEHIAARFAAKEAVIKILGSGLFSVRLAEIVVRRGHDGEPSLRLSGRAHESAVRAGVRQWLVSLSHTDRVAGAVVVALGDSEA